MTDGLRKAVFFVLLIALAIVGYKYMIRPANDNLSEAKERVQSKLDKLEEFEKAKQQRQAEMMKKYFKDFMQRVFINFRFQQIYLGIWSEFTP